jgi:hypothetical protein
MQIGRLVGDEVVGIEVPGRLREPGDARDEGAVDARLAVYSMGLNALTRGGQRRREREGHDGRE